MDFANWSIDARGQRAGKGDRFIFSQTKCQVDLLSNAGLRGAVDLTCEKLQEATNWESRYRDESLACDRPIPEDSGDSGVIIIEEEYIEETAVPENCVT